MPISPGIPSSAAAKGIQQDSRLYRPDDDDDLDEEDEEEEDEEEDESNEKKEEEEVVGSTDQHLIAANAEWVQREKVFRGVSEEMFV